MKKRPLRPEELDLWNQVARTTSRLQPERKGIEKMPEIEGLIEKPGKPSPPAREPIPHFELGAKAKTHTSHTSAAANPPRNGRVHVSMDRKAYDKLRRGKLKPEGRIDLHGMTQDRAHTALNAFIMSAFAQDKRLVLVITGKGKKVEDYGPIPTRPGVLKRNVPHWLQSPPMNQVVIQVAEAHGRHGGGGAYYVYLRRRR